MVNHMIEFSRDISWYHDYSALRDSIIHDRRCCIPCLWGLCALFWDWAPHNSLKNQPNNSKRSLSVPVRRLPDTLQNAWGRELGGRVSPLTVSKAQMEEAWISDKVADCSLNHGPLFFKNGLSGQEAHQLINLVFFRTVGNQKNLPRGISSPALWGVRAERRRALRMCTRGHLF